MKKSSRAMRHLILSKLYEHLEARYGMEGTREEFTSGEISLHEVEAILAFKSDPRLDELRGALERLEDGSYGVCLSCKREISRDLLETDPVRRMCSACETRFSHSEAQGTGHTVHA